MPLFKTINFNTTTQIFVWKITESFETLYQDVQLKEQSLVRLHGMKSELHQRGFLSVRKLLQEAGYTDFDLYYDASGKPHLPNGKYISISHSHYFSTIIISDASVGIDIEMQREKIIRIADKFVSKQELEPLQNSDNAAYIKKLTANWGAKEAIFKICNEKGISFKNHIQVYSLDNKDQKTSANLEFENTKRQFSIYFEEIEDFSLVYAFEN